MIETLSHAFAPGETRHWRFGSLDLWVHRQQRSWLFAAAPGASAAAPSVSGAAPGASAGAPGPSDAAVATSVASPSGGPATTDPALPPDAAEELTASGPDELKKPDDVEWKRVVPRSTDATIRFSPVMADRPVVVRTQFPLTLNPRAATTFYADLPVWVRVSAAPAGALKADESAGANARREVPVEYLYETPAKLLSNTWYGGPLTGKLCYTLDTTLHYDPELIRRGDVVVGCRLTITNQTKRPFSVGKIAVFANLLSVYRVSETSSSPLPAGYWTEDARAILTGDDELTVGVGDKAPAADARLVGPARERSSDSIIKKSLILLKKISNY